MVVYLAWLSRRTVYSSEISRTDVAQVTVAAILKGPATDFTTFELNQQEGLAKAMSSLPDLSSDLIHTGQPSYDALLDGLLSDADMRKKYNDLVPVYKASDSIEPLSKLQT